jgi:hypothetical protein
MEEGVRCYCKLVPTNMHWTTLALLPFRKFATPMYQSLCFWWIKSDRWRDILTDFRDDPLACRGSTLDIKVPKINVRLWIIKYYHLANVSSNEENVWMTE